MSEVEKQESQKTVVAFITGLLIGGLLVWIFSSTPEEKKEAKTETTNTEEVAKTEVKQETVAKTETAGTEMVGEGSLTVVDQKAGPSVMLGAVKTPTKNGWIVVRDYMDGVPGNVLGAARYSADEGLMPTNVTLMRPTTVGGSYQVVFFTQGGELGFNLGEDVAIEGIATTFKAN